MSIMINRIKCKLILIFFLFFLICLMHKVLGKIYMSSDEYDYGSISGLPEDYTPKSKVRTFNQIDVSSSYQKRIDSVELNLKMKRTIDTYHALLYNFMLFARDEAALKWKKGLPVLNETREVRFMRVAESHAEHLRADVDFILKVIIDIREMMLMVQFSLTSNWYARKYADDILFPEKIRDFNEIDEDVFRIQDYTVIMLSTFHERLHRYNKCMSLFAERSFKQRRGIGMKQSLFLYGLLRSTRRVCHKFFKHPKSDFHVMMLPDEITPSVYENPKYVNATFNFTALFQTSIYDSATTSSTTSDSTSISDSS